MTNYSPGDIVPVSGIYDAHHNCAHPKQVTCVKDERFPPCRECSKVHYTLNKKTEH